MSVTKYGTQLENCLVINSTFATDEPYKGSHCFKWGFLTINAEKMWPWGMTPRCPSSVILVSGVVMTGVRAGVHSKTKTYMEPSNRDCINPRQRILWSERDKKIISNWINKQNIDNFSLCVYTVRGHGWCLMTKLCMLILCVLMTLLVGFFVVGFLSVPGKESCGVKETKYQTE